MTDETVAALNYLKEQGHDIGQGFIPSDTTKVHIWVDNRACSNEQIRIWAALERKKESVSGIDSTELVDLAVVCQHVAESGEVDSATASQARALDQEWNNLVKTATPPPSTTTEAKAINSQAQGLADRMLKFLITQLTHLSA